VDRITFSSQVALLTSMTTESQAGEYRLFTLVDTGSMSMKFFVAHLLYNPQIPLGEALGPLAAVALVRAVVVERVFV
jgi:hypothetical protein